MQCYFIILNYKRTHIISHYCNEKQVLKIIWFHQLFVKLLYNQYRFEFQNYETIYEDL